jgi:hypothetical protein
MILKRVAANEYGTFGVLINNNVPFAVTLERPWNNNQRNISCIPTGRYVCKRVQSPKFGNTFEITNVTGRSHILFHKGNLDDDTHGCILIGEEYGKLKGEPAILASKKGFNEFKEILERENSFDLIITYI